MLIVRCEKYAVCTLHDDLIGDTEMAWHNIKKINLECFVSLEPIIFSILSTHDWGSRFGIYFVGCTMHMFLNLVL